MPYAPVDEPQREFDKAARTAASLFFGIPVARSRPGMSMTASCRGSHYSDGVRISLLISLMSVSIRAASLLLLPSFGITAQNVATLPEKPTCVSCEIQVTRTLTISDSVVATGLGSDPIVRRDSRGRLFVAGRGIEGVVVLGPRGEFVRTVGRRGEGPGEFINVTTLLVGVEDTVYIFDSSNRRVTILSPALGYVRDVSMNANVGANRSVVVGASDFVFAADIRSASGVGEPLHRFASTGGTLSHVRSFGGGGGVFLATSAAPALPKLTAGASGDFWAVAPRYFALVNWSLDGRQLREFRRDAPWLREAAAPPLRVGPQNVPLPRPAITAIQRDASGLLWILGVVRSEEWKPPHISEHRGMRMAEEVQSADANFDTVIEVFDPVAGRLLASMRHPYFMNQFADKSYLVHKHEYPDGSIGIELIQFSLVHK